MSIDSFEIKRGVETKKDIIEELKAENNLLGRLLEPFVNKVPTEDLGDYIKIWDKLFKEDVDFFNYRPSFVESFVAEYGIDKLKEIVKNPDHRNIFKKINKISNLNTYTSREEVEKNSEREKMPVSIECDENEKKQKIKKELEDILSNNGLEELAKHFVEKVIISDFSQNYNGKYGYRSKELSINAELNDPRNPNLVSILIHEIGHSVYGAIGNHREMQQYFDLYSMEVIYGDKFKSSEYLEALSLYSGRDNRTYLHEAFAEDFRVYLTQPSLIPDGRKKIFSAMLDEFLEDFDIEKIRQDIRHIYGNLYGVGVKEVQREVKCKKQVEGLAEKMNKINY